MKSPDLQHLLGAWLDGRITGDESQRLQEMLELIRDKIVTPERFQTSSEFYVT